MKRSASLGELDQSQLLDAVPTCNDAVRVERDGGSLVLWVPLRERWWTRPLRSLGLPIRTEKGIALDALGRQVWEACDGEHRLEEIIESFAERHKLRFHEARASVMQFLRSLAERNLVVLAVPERRRVSAGHGGAA